MADPLLAPFAELCGALRGLKEQVEQLSHVHEAVDDFNAAFGTFQGAMAVHASCLSFPKLPKPAPKPAPKPVLKRSSLPKDKTPPGTNIPAPNKRVSPGEKKQEDKQPRKSEEKPKPGKRHKRSDSLGPTSMQRKRRKTTTPKAGQGWTWERHIREKIPRKYQSPAELKKLENIVLYLKNRRCAISISDLVSHSGLPVIRCKEILQTLMKLELIERKRENSGFVYSFGVSH